MSTNKSYEYDLTIIVVTWNSEEEIAECLNAVYKNKTLQEKIKIETIIIDNGSVDTTVNNIKNFIKLIDKEITLIENKENLGFTKACNQGLKASRGKEIMFLNPDTQVMGDAVLKLYEHLNSDENIGAVAPQQISLGNNILHSCRTFPKYRDIFFEFLFLSRIFSKNKFFGRWKMKYFDHNSLRQVDQPMAAGLMVKKDVFDKIGGLDEQYTMFFNDVDFCKNIYKAGYKIMFDPVAKLIHHIGASVFRDRARMIKIWNKDCRKYFKKHNFNVLLYPFFTTGLFVSQVFRVIYHKIRRN